MYCTSNLISPSSPLPTTSQTFSDLTSIAGNKSPAVAKTISSTSSTTNSNFFSFKWILQRSTKKVKTTKTSSKLSRKRKLSHKKNCDKSQSTSSQSRSLRQSYSFDDVDRFLKVEQKKQHRLNEKYKSKYSDVFRSNQDIYASINGKGKLDHTTSKEDQIECKICFMSCQSEEMHSLWTCGCKFCKNCLSKYLEQQIQDGDVQVLTCPDGDCPKKCENELSLSEIELFVTAESLSLLHRYRRNWLVDSDPLRTWCPTPNCDTICSLQLLTHRSRPVPFYCCTCDKNFCSNCRSDYHPGVECDRLRKEEDLAFAEGTVKHCPRCCVPIERDEGCAQMMCRVCKHMFCWYCLQSLEDDFLLRHYDKGPCKNKLGHTRASVIWHRIQVVGIFAGFGLLLLLASPMFLLAAPCLLCCKCTCKYDDDSDDRSDEKRNRKK